MQSDKPRLKVPVDCCTAPGMLMCVGSLFLNRGLPATSVTIACRIIAVLEKQCNYNGTLKLLRDLPQTHLEVKDNEVRVEAWHAALNYLQLGGLVQLSGKYFPHDRVVLTVGKLVFLMMAARQRQSLRQHAVVSALHRRLIFMFCQHLELELDKPESRLESTCPNPSRCTTFHPLSRDSRSRGNPVFRDRILSTWGAKSGGFASTKDELDLQQLGLVAEGSKVAQRASGEFLIRYFAKTSEALKAHLHSQKAYKSINFCLDAARVCKMEVLSFIIRVGTNAQGALVQILPDTAPMRDSATTMKALEMALEGGLPEKGRKLVNTAKHLVTYRASTKQQLHALKNALTVLLPDFSFAQTVPDQVLAPRGNRIRFEMTDAEKRIMGEPLDKARYFLFDNSTGECTPDFYPRCERDVMQLIFSADEGTPGFLSWLWIANEGCRTLMWADLFHKLHRKQAQAISSMPEASSLMKRLTKIFRSSRAPWSTAKFGKQRVESRTRMLEAVQANPSCKLLESFLDGLAKDMGVSPATLSNRQAIEALKQHAGTWHCRLMETVWQWWEQGINPWDAMGTSCNADEGQSDEQNNHSIRALYFEVLSDSTNQDLMRSNTVLEACEVKAMEYLNVLSYETDRTAKETLEFHFQALIHWLSAMFEVPDYHVNYPWRAVLALDDGSWPGVLEHMKEEWAFVSFLDKLQNSSKIYVQMGFTRMQLFRELFIEAEAIGFDANHRCSSEVRHLACSMAASSNGASDDRAILTSLANELTFNDLRDCQRRHSKSEMSKATNVCAAAVRSAAIRNPLDGIVLDNKDWMMDESLRSLRSNILASAREGDKDLGISIYGLVHNKKCDALTKPHVFCQRLRLYQALKAKFLDCQGALDVEMVMRDAWASNVPATGCLWQMEQDNPDSVCVVLQAGPDSVRYMFAKQLQDYDAGTYELDREELEIRETLDFRMSKGLLSMPDPIVCPRRGLLFRAQKWAPPGEFLCENMIASVKAGVLIEYGKSIGLNLSKASQQSRVRQIMEFHKYPQEFIQETLENVPVKVQKKKEKSATDEAGDDDSESEAEAQEVLDSLNYNIEENEAPEETEGDGQPGEASSGSAAAAVEQSASAAAGGAHEGPSEAAIATEGVIADDTDGNRKERSASSSGYDRKPAHNFDVPQHELAPGCKAYIGQPDEESPFIQVRILPKLLFNGKKSRAFSFVPEGSRPLPRGATRSFQDACTCATTWSNFFNSLSEDQKKDIREKYPSQATGQKAPGKCLEPELLGVEEEATQEDIIRAYRQRALEQHPDKGGDKDDFDALNKAYATLNDDARRRAYDLQLAKARERELLVEGGRSTFSKQQLQAPMPRIKTAPTPGSKRQAQMRTSQPGKPQCCAHEWKGMGS
ncbi:LDJ2, partial [Symbiodinium necroappetens]